MKDFCACSWPKKRVCFLRLTLTNNDVLVNLKRPHIVQKSPSLLHMINTSGMINIITAVMMNVFSMPGITFFVAKYYDNFWSPFAGSQLLLMIVSWHREGRSDKQYDHCDHHYVSGL